MAEEKETAKESAKEAEGECTISEEEIDQTLKESFPASDPPQWTLGVEPHRGPEVKPDEESESSEDESSLK